ncbi:MAG: T9SS type A sorting domain-containing protein [Bacteroidales bacterium]|nr:T9SS type A sorting domain-containing protein [Bacteroidales bacterium]
MKNKFFLTALIILSFSFSCRLYSQINEVLQTSENVLEFENYVFVKGKLYHNNPIEITGNDEWIGNRILNSDVIIKGGGTLTIYDNVAFPENARLIVEQGGKLILHGGTLTSACSGLWKGVEVWGNPYVPQNENDQGTVIIADGVIENAETGILVANSQVHYTEGGIVVAIGATFRNNRKGISFKPYEFSNYSRFLYCKFITDSGLKSGVTPEYFIGLFDVNNIKIENCTFENVCELPDQYNIDDRGYGILSSNSGFTMNYDTMRFLTYGVKAFAFDPVYTATIKQSVFENNKRSVYLGQVDYVTIQENIFKILPLDQEELLFCGLYLDECDGFSVEDNEFIKAGGYGTSIGLIVNNSGVYPNEIYRNVFYNLRYGIVAQNCNRNPFTHDGLQLLCNDFSYCGYDISVSTEEQGAPEEGIAHYQGSGEPFATATANNLFSYSGSEIIPSDINNECKNIIYYYPLNAEILNVEPLYYTTNTVLKQVGSYSDQWVYSDGCPPNNNPGGGGGSGTDGLWEQMAIYDQKADSTENLLQQLIDGGDTEELKLDVDMSTPPESMEIYNELINNSPYLSNTVVESSIYKETVLPNAMLRDIMVANPQSAKSDELIDKIDDRWDPMPGYMKDEILEGLGIVAAKELLEAELSRYKRIRNQAFNSLVRYFLNDTILPPQSVSDSLMDLFNSETTVHAKYRLAFKYLDLGQYQQGDDILDLIPVLFELNDTEFAEYQTMYDYFDFVTEIMQDSVNLLNPDSLQLLSLSALYSEGSGDAARYARNILLALNEIQYEEPITLPYPYKVCIQDEFDFFADVSEEKTHQISVYPNPSSSYLIIEYELEKKPENVMIIISDGSGKSVKIIALNKRIDQQLVDTKDLKQGIYIATLFINGINAESVKFAVVH